MRRARPDDARAIAQVHVDSWKAYVGLIPQDRLDRVTLARREPQWREWLAESREPVLTVVAESAASIGGFCSVAIPARGGGEGDRVAEIPALYVTPSLWGGGLGTALMAAALAEMRGAGCEEGILWMLRGNERAERFYERSGWSLDGGRRESQYFPDLPDLVELRFRRDLRPSD